MKAIVTCIALIVGVAFSSFAQDKIGKQNAKHIQKPLTPQEKADKRSARMSKELQLTQDQTAKIKNLILGTETKSQSIKKNAANVTDKTAMKAEMKKVRLAYKDELKSILTADQHAKYVQMQQQKRQDHKGHHGHHDKAGS